MEHLNYWMKLEMRLHNGNIKCGNILFNAQRQTTTKNTLLHQKIKSGQRNPSPNEILNFQYVIYNLISWEFRLTNKKKLREKCWKKDEICIRNSDVVNWQLTCPSEFICSEWKCENKRIRKAIDDRTAYNAFVLHK